VAVHRFSITRRRVLVAEAVISSRSREIQRAASVVGKPMHNSFPARCATLGGVRLTHQSSWGEFDRGRCVKYVGKTKGGGPAAAGYVECRQ